MAFKHSALLLLLIASGCVAPAPVCDSPYILVGTGCCLDEDANRICDRDQPAASTVPPATAPPSTAPETSTTEEPTTTVTATTQPPSTSTLPTAAPAACNVNSDCGEDKVSSVYCEGSSVVEQIMKPMCISPGTPEARCEYKGRLSVRRTLCDGYCLAGACYPSTCGNLAWDYNEEDVDCGGACIPCNSTIVKRCSYNADCGRDTFRPGYGCSEGDVVREKVAYKCTANRTCQSVVELVLVDECTGNRTCIQGDSECQAGGNCWDCVRNQDEDGVDCGGRCTQCAPTPPPSGVYTTKRDLNLTGVVYGGLAPIHQGYLFKFVKPVVNGTCTYGAVVSAAKSGEPPVELTVTRYRNAFLGGKAVGFYWGNNSAARIWAAIQ